MNVRRIALLGAANSIHLQRWANALAARGQAVSLLSQQRCAPALLDPAVECVWLPHARGFGYLANARAVRRHLTAWRADLLNAHYASGYGTTAALCGFRPTLLSVWGSDVYDFPYQTLVTGHARRRRTLEGDETRGAKGDVPGGGSGSGTGTGGDTLRGRLLRWNLRRATALAATSHAMARQVHRLLPELPDGAISITPFGVDLAGFAPGPGACGPGQREPGRLTLGSVKSLAPKYGIDLLLRAFAGVLRDPQVRALPAECRLLIVGDGPQRPALEALARALGIDDRTTFAGAVAHRDVPHWLNQLDIYCAPSRLDSESFGVAVIEASACALPVVVSDAGGLPEVVRHGETGLVVPRDDAAALQAALTRLVLDGALRTALGRAGRAHVARAYAWADCVDRMLACYERTIAPANRTENGAVQGADDASHRSPPDRRA